MTAATTYGSTPAELRGMVSALIASHVDQEALDLTLRVEQEEREVLAAFSQRRYGDGAPV